MAIRSRRMVFGATGLMIAWYGNRMPKAVVPGAAGAPGQSGRGLVHGAERACLCRTMGVRPDLGGGRGRVRRDHGRNSGDDRLLPIVAGESESGLSLTISTSQRRSAWWLRLGLRRITRAERLTGLRVDAGGDWRTFWVVRRLHRTVVRRISALLTHLLHSGVSWFQSLRRLLWFFTGPRTVGVHGVPLTPDGKVVLVMLSYARGWRLPGGGKRKTEDSRTAMIRELREEIGLTNFDSVDLGDGLRTSPRSPAWRGIAVRGPRGSLPA